MDPEIVKTICYTVVCCCAIGAAAYVLGKIFE